MSKAYVRILVLSLLCLGLLESITIGERAMPEKNLAYPVLIMLDNGKAASGFYLRDTQKFYLVTAKHVLFKQSEQSLLVAKVTLISYPAKESVTGRLKLEVDLAALHKKGLVKIHKTHDVAVVQLGETKGHGEEYSIFWLKEIKRVRRVKLLSSCWCKSSLGKG